MDTQWFHSFLLPFCICVGLPITVMGIYFKYKSDADKRRAAVLTKALEMGRDVDIEKLTAALGKSAQEVANSRLQKGLIWFSMGVLLIATAVFNSICGQELSSDSVTIPLLFGGVTLAMGFGYLVVWNVARKQQDS